MGQAYLRPALPGIFPVIRILGLLIKPVKGKYGYRLPDSKIDFMPVKLRLVADFFPSGTESHWLLGSCFKNLVASGSAIEERGIWMNHERRWIFVEVPWADVGIIFRVVIP